MIFQDFNLLPTLSVYENVTLPILLRGERLNSEIEERARETLRRVGLAEKQGRLPETLSGGEMQRVSIARALCLRPKLLLADEPTGSLDSRNSDEILNLLTEINRELALTVVMVTHSHAAAVRAGSVLEMEDGRFRG